MVGHDPQALGQVTGLRARYDAVVVATGALVGRDLPIPGRDLAGVHFAMEYLVQQNRTGAGDTVVFEVTGITSGSENVPTPPLLEYDGTNVFGVDDVALPSVQFVPITTDRECVREDDLRHLGLYCRADNSPYVPFYVGYVDAPPPPVNTTTPIPSFWQDAPAIAKLGEVEIVLY